MKLFESERPFWKKVFLAAIKAGKTVNFATTMANDSVTQLRATD